MQLEIRSLPYTVAMGKFIGKNKTEQKSKKGTRQTQKIILGGGYQHGHKKVKIN